MKKSISQLDLRNIKTYKNKNIIIILKNLSGEEIKTIDASIIALIASLDLQTINTIFRNSHPLLQSKMWENEVIQKALILGHGNDKHLSSEEMIRNLENLHKVIKSLSVKKQIYKSEYFIKIIIQNNNLEPRFFHFYNIKKVFENITLSQEFNKLPSDKQLQVIAKLNKYSHEVLLPNDFRQRYPSIDILIPEFRNKPIDEEIFNKLTEEEMIFLNYINDTTNSERLQQYIINSIKNNHQSFKDFFEALQQKTLIINAKINTRHLFPKVSLEEKVYHILLTNIDDEIIKEKLLRYIIHPIMKDCSLNPEEVYQTLKRNLNNQLLTYHDINILNNNYYRYKDLRMAFYLKFNIVLRNVDYLSGITINQMLKLNVKHINKLIKLLNDTTQDELSAIYSIAIKMYFIFGYERSLEILNNKYGQCDKIFFDNIAKTDVTKIPLKQEGNKYLPDIDQRFIKFMFENNHDNHFINMLNNKTSQLYRRWYYLYNNYDDILEKCHHEITLKKVTDILESDKYDISYKLITPDLYLLRDNNFIENIILGNKTIYTNSQILEEIIKIYSQMKVRTESSIPYVKGMTIDGYQYHMIKFDDPQIFTLGYQANCCIRTMDIGHNHLLHAALCRNGRVLLITDNNGNLAAFSPLKRNGNVLIANSIECIDKKAKHQHLIAEAFKTGIIDIVNTSLDSQEPLDLAVIGQASYLKPMVTPFPSEYPIPTIYEKHDEVYQHTDEYHLKLDIIYQTSKFKLDNIIVKDPNVSYMDPREEIKFIDLSTDVSHLEEVINIINAINYSLNKENYQQINKYLLKSVYYTKDWYIADTYQGFIGTYQETDYRAKEEFDYYMNIICNNHPKTLTKEK